MRPLGRQTRERDRWPLSAPAKVSCPARRARPLADAHHDAGNGAAWPPDTAHRRGAAFLSRDHSDGGALGGDRASDHRGRSDSPKGARARFSRSFSRLKRDDSAWRPSANPSRGSGHEGGNILKKTRTKWAD